MAEFPESQISNHRFAEYVAELHEFSETHRVPCGRPGDIAELLRGLASSEAFKLEFGSMIRSIVLREQLQASEFEIFTIVAVAWGGVPKSDLSNKLPPMIEELRDVVHDLLRQEAIGAPKLVKPPADRLDIAKTPLPDVDDTIRELEQTSPDVQIYRQLLKMQDGNEPQSSQSHYDLAAQRASFSHEDELVSSIAKAQEHEGLSVHKGFPSVPPVAAPPKNEERRDGASGIFRVQDDPSETHEIVRVRRLDLSAFEIMAAGLTGLVLALLFSVGSLPVYRTQVSVNLPAAGPTGTSETGIEAGSPAYALVSGQLTGQVAELFLARPHPKPILRQDALSRGMRDLHLGGNEPILYAELVAETARRTKIRRVNSLHIDEIACESWSAQLATTFCNELLAMLDQPPQSQSGPMQETGLVRAIDEAVAPGVQVYPHWYLQSVAGSAVGCLAGVSVGFIRRAGLRRDGINGAQQP